MSRPGKVSETEFHTLWNHFAQEGKIKADLRDRLGLTRSSAAVWSQVMLRLRPKRYRCPYCEGAVTTTERADWYDSRGVMPA
jgi:hypothetical protein